jgi:ElaB/YqjD/DUF883 family membrane-anchored ribosome-binding protein
MAEEQTTKDAWREVGRQFEVLGESLAQAFRTTWQDEENRQHLRDMQAGLQKMVDEIGKAMKEVGESPEGQQVRQKAKQAAESARVAGRQAWQDARPHLVSSLRQITAELQKIIDKLAEERGQ